MLFEQNVFVQPQLPAAGTIYRQNPPFSVKGKIAHRRVIVEIHILGTGLLKLALNRAQFIVLQGKFNLVGVQFVKYFTDFARGDIIELEITLS